MDPLPLHGEALLKALVEVSIRLGGARSIDGVFGVAGQGALELGLQLVVVQFRGEQGYLRYLNRAPVTEYGKSLLRPAPRSLNPGIDAAFKLGSPLFVADLAKWLGSVGVDSSVASWGEQVGFGRMVITPLAVNQAKWGALILASATLEQGDVPALTLFSSQLHAALEAADTIARLEARNSELEAVHAIAAAGAPDLNSAKLLQTVATAVRADAAALHRLDREAGEFVLVGDLWGYTGPVADQWRRFKAVGPESHLTWAGPVSALPAESGTRESGIAHLARVPLRYQGQPVGMLSLGRRSAELPFTDAEVSTAEALGVQVASLIERARLIAEAERRVRQLELLYELTSASSAVGQVTPVIERLLARMLDALPVDVAVIHFLEGIQLRLAGWKVRQGIGPFGPPTPEFMPLDGSSVASQTALTRKVAHFNTTTFPVFTVGAASRYGLRHMMSAPLLVGERLVGTLTVGRRADLVFSTEETQLVESCAARVAVILEHARLYDDLKVSYDELARAQAEVVKHERLAALGELSAVMAHEVRNPLGVIFNSLASLKRLLRPTGDAELLLNIIGEEADRLNRIVGDLLDFARPFEAQKKPISLEAILVSAVDAAVAAVPASLAQVVVEFAAELPRFLIDGQLIRQAFVNLVVNALQAMPSGGKVTVRALPEERAGELWARVEVHDEGSGISPSSAERIFQPFFTTKATGTGLGLAVVKRIIDAHHGEVMVKARPDRGTTFTVRLPGGAPGAPGAPAPEASDADPDSEDTIPSRQLR